jgi:hypothetical protein
MRALIEILFPETAKKLAAMDKYRVQR